MDEATFKYEVRFDFENETTGEEETIVINTQSTDTDSIKDMAYQSLAERVGVEFADVKNEYTVLARYLDFNDPPWDEFEEVTDTFSDFDGVQNVSEESPFEGKYRAPRLHLSLLNSADKQQVENEVIAYYDGFEIDETDSDNRVSVIVSPVSE